MVIVYAGPLSRVDVHQRLLVGDHVVQLLQLPLLPRQLVVHDSTTASGRARLPPPLVTLLGFSAGFVPLLDGPLLAPATAPARAPASALCAALGGPAGSLAAPAPLVPAVFVAAVGAGAASLFDDAPKLVSGRTPAPGPTPAPTRTPAPAPGPTPAPTRTPAPAIFTLSGSVISSADTGLAVLRSKILHHGLQLVALWLFFSEKSGMLIRIIV